jgi:hypothetical protein
MGAMTRLRTLGKMFWPQKCLGLLSGHVKEEWARYVSKKHSETFKHYAKLAESMRLLVRNLESFADNHHLIKAREQVQKSLESQWAPANANESLIAHLNRIVAQIKDWDGYKVEQEIVSILSNLSPVDNSQLADVIGRIYDEIQIDLSGRLNDARDACLSGGGK